MSRAISYAKTFALWELLQGLRVTLRNFFRPSVTLEYPEVPIHPGAVLEYGYGPNKVLTEPPRAVSEKRG